MRLRIVKSAQAKNVTLKSSEGVSTSPNKSLSHIVSGSFLKETLASDTYKID